MSYYGCEKFDSHCSSEIVTRKSETQDLNTGGESDPQTQEKKADCPKISLLLVGRVCSRKNENILAQNVSKNRHLEGGPQTCKQRHNSKPSRLVVLHYVFESDVAIDNFFFGNFLRFQRKDSSLITADYRVLAHKPSWVQVTKIA